ncbi:type II secretion system minor pseudopilin GspK [Sphingoaurantiacus capsulatus]|uniref:Type II secretion system protein K n=1 Tax=Sphingoaurantiacus capsulatus TaxID=1771310 RepID=A0ABV7X4N1_9SPHN
MKRGQEGAALLSVLLLVAVLGGIAAASFDRMRLATNLEFNAAALEQARNFAVAGELLATTRIDDLMQRDPGRTTLAGDWNGRTTVLPLPVGEARVTVRDGGNCFNLNSVVMNDPPSPRVIRPRGVQQFEALMVSLGLLGGDARRVAMATVDWIDTDTVPVPGGVEDEGYDGGEDPYRTGNTLLAEVSELRAIAGVTPEIYELLRPWVCALPTTALSPININTLAPEQARLIAMMMPNDLDQNRAQGMLAQRPEAGWNGSYDFWRLPALQGLVPMADVLEQPQVRTRWYQLDMQLRVGEAELHETALIDASRPPARVVARRWTADE